MSRIACSIASFSLMVIFFGCKKDGGGLSTESLSANKKEISFNVSQVGKKCRIVSIVEPFSSYRNDTALFEYNKWGDPVSVTRYPWPKTGSPNVFFSYDNKHRLTEARGMYRDNDGEWYRKYFYSGPGEKQPIMDSSYTFPVFQNGILISYYYSRATWIFYDSQGRVIKDSIVAPGGRIAVWQYSYDASGNRAALYSPGDWIFYNYDNKVNPHVTSEIFQFVDRDYSVNNPFVAETYNQEGLPTTLNLPVNGPFLSFLGTGIRQGTIIYDCK